MLLSRLLALPMAMFLAASAAGMDMDYEGEVDRVTGLPVTNSAGEAMTEVDTQNIVDPGFYALVLMNSDAQYQILAFQIVPETTGAITTYEMPSGFSIQSVGIDGEEQDATGRTSVAMKADGHYHMAYRAKDRPGRGL